MKKILICFICAAIWNITKCSFSKNVAEEVYATNNYENENEEEAEICINKNEISFHNIYVAVHSTG